MELAGKTTVLTLVSDAHPRGWSQFTSVSGPKMATTLDENRNLLSLPRQASAMRANSCSHPRWSPFWVALTLVNCDHPSDSVVRELKYGVLFEFTSATPRKIQIILLYFSSRT